MTRKAAVSRRRFLGRSAAAAGGLTVAFSLPELAGPKAAAAEAAKPFAPNAFVRVAADGTVSVVVKHFEMGQGTYTGLPQIVAEELDVDWSKIKVEAAPADAKLYNNLFWGPAQGTGGSTSLANSWDQLRRAGAEARIRLIGAAAKLWNADAKTLTTDKGFVVDPKTKRRASYGALAGAAAKIEAPKEIPLKDPKDFKVIGQSLPRTDGLAKSTGKAVFGVDMRLPGMLTALVQRPPLFGGTVKSVDDAEAKKVKGVRAALTIPQGVAVLASGYWAAKTARDKLKIAWEGGAKVSSAALAAEYKEKAKTPGAVAKKSGDAAAALAGAAKKFAATYEFPFLAHAPMEPLNAVVRLDKDGAEFWTGSQFQTFDQGIPARILGLKPEQVKINTLYAGGSFGRRATPTADYMAEAAMVAKAALIAGITAPIRIMWSREDDIKGGYYRPLYVHALAAGIDDKGMPVSWQHRIVGQSILAGTPFAGMIKDGVDATSVEGAANLPYEIPNMLVDLHTTNPGIPILWWRSVGSTHTAFSTETFLDVLAEAAGKDPVEYRRALLAKHPRHLAVLNLAAEKAGWGKPLEKGRGRGVAVHESFHSFVAQVAEVTVKPDGSYKVDRVICAVDCGIAVSPDVIAAQMEGGIGFGLGAALFGAITLKDGEVEQSNFHDYRVLRLDEMPAVEVHIVKSGAKPTGVGEPGVPPIAPAVANALFAATGKRITKLPIGEKLS
jgi:isoquinoline 1-oxidoreductase beta subunit